MLRSQAALSFSSISSLRRCTRPQWRISKFTTASKGSTQRNNATRLFLTGDANSVTIRTSTFPESMRDALSIIQAVERKYGAVKEFKFYRDYEVSTNYQLIIDVAFRDPASRKKISNKSEELQVVLPPPLPTERFGGVGLSDLEAFLGMPESVINPSSSSGVSVPKYGSVMEDMIEESQAKSESENAERVITCSIRPRSTFYTSSHVAHYHSPRQEREAISRQLVNWGGFHEFSPIDKNTPISDVDFFSSSPLEHVRMRYCLRKASTYLDMPNPYEYSPEKAPGSETARDVDSQLEWEPLQGSNVEGQGSSTTDLECSETVASPHGKVEELVAESSVDVTEDTKEASGHVIASSTSPPLPNPDSLLQPDAPNATPLGPLPDPMEPASPTRVEDAKPLSQSASTQKVSTLTASSAKKTNSRELTAQLRAARLLARQVEEEHRKNAKLYTSPSKTTIVENVTNAHEPLLKQNVSEPATSTEQPDLNAKQEPLERERHDVPQEEAKDVASKIRNVWGRLF
ncbi:hypothetical protein AX17_004618 [Amanita inopinata Kibby_2008]|nr:hypothetical protein AX17_004618 [Amanita inopinata Kibby_2008]